MPRGHNDTPGVIAPPPLIYAVPLTVGLYFNRSNPFPVMPRSFAVPIGGVLAMASIIITIAAFIQFGRAHTSVMPYKPTTAIIESGLFALTRNPLYLAMTIAYVGITLIVNTVWPLLLLPLALLMMHRGVIVREEQYLEQKFGDPYLSYKSRVRRWL
jgi:protein-S-isoprenylcysteine O-methyltransferase Ste14